MINNMYMKKRVKFLILGVLLVAATCFGCGSVRESDDDNEITPDVAFNLSYNRQYADYGEGNGYLINDIVNLSEIAFNVSASDLNATLTIENGEVNHFVRSGERGFSGTVQLSAVGTYTFKAEWQYKGESYDKSIGVNVVAGDRPEKVEFVITHGDEVVTEMKGGNRYTVTALFMRGGEPFEYSGGMYGWDRLGTGTSFVRIFENLFEPIVEKRTFQYVYTNNRGEQNTVICPFEITVSDNLDKSQYPFGARVYYNSAEFTDGKATVKTNCVTSAARFVARLSAEFVFDNGETQSLTYSEEQPSDSKKSFYLAISYGDDFVRYRSDSFNLKYAEGAFYQFDPNADTATVQVRLWYADKALDDEKQLILDRVMPTSISISSASGRKKEKFNIASANNKLVDYTWYTKTEGDKRVLEIPVACDMDGDGEVEDEYLRNVSSESDVTGASSKLQYFRFGVTFSAGADITDYTVVFQGQEPVKSYSHISDLYKRRVIYYYAAFTGECEITVRSRFDPSVSDTVTVRVVDPVADYTLLNKYDSLLNTIGVLPRLFGAKECDSPSVVREFRLSSYNRFQFTTRALAANERIEFSDIGFVEGQFGAVTAKLYRNNEQLDTCTINYALAVPRFSLTVDGATYNSTGTGSAWSTTLVDQTMNDPSDESVYYGGYLRTLTVSSTSTLRDMNIEVTAVEGVQDNYRIYRDYLKGEINILYRYNITERGETYDYILQVMKIKVTQE